MHSVASVKSSSGAATYFAKDDYYTGEHASEASSWGGTGAQALGLEGEVSKEAFEKILNGELPNGDKVGQVENRQSGIDLTFSMPKSASVMAYVAGDERVLAAHMAAVKAVMGWTEKQFAEGRSYENKKSGEPVRTGNLVYAMFQHDTSRALDPQGHIHVIVANLTRMADGAWRALHNGQLWKNNSVIGAAYHAQFREQLEKIGYATEITGKHGQFEIAGVPEGIIQAFSQRRQDILDKAAEIGATSSQALREITRRTRDAKLNVEDRAALRDTWRARAAALEFDGRQLVADAQSRSGDTRFDQRPATLARIRQTVIGIASALGERFRPGDPLITSGTDRARMTPVAVRTEHAVASAVRILAQREAAFGISELAKTALDLGLKGVTAEQVDTRISQLIARDQLIPGANERTDGVVTHVATHEALTTERAILAEIQAGKGAVAPIVGAHIVVDRLQAEAGAQPLNAGQLAAATMALSSRDRIVAVQGVSGAGKSTMLRSVSRIAEAQGKTALGLAIMKSTASDLGKGAGIEARTVSSFIHAHARAALAGHGEGYDAARQRLAGTVLVLDEASMVGSDQMRHLVGIANALRVDRLVMVGDRQQISAVDAGKAFALSQAGGVATARMDENLRQRTDQLRTVAALTNRGEVRAAMAALGDKVIASPEHVNQAAERWLGLSSADRDKTALFSSGRVARAELNARVQEGLKTQGLLKGEGVTFPVLDKVNTTREELRYAHNYRAGQLIDLAYPVRELGLPRGTFEILGVTAKGHVAVKIGGRTRMFDPRKISPLDKRDAVQLAEREHLKLHENDKIRWTKNDPTRGLDNASLARIVSATSERITVEATDGKIHELKPGDPMLERMALAYAVNMHMAQGLTTDRAIAVMSSHESNLSNQRLFNVTATRVRDDIELFTDNRDKLTAAIERNEGNKASALETIGRIEVDPPRGGTNRGAKPAKPQFNPDPPADIRHDPTLDLTRHRVAVDPGTPDLPLPEKEIGLEL